ncbi:SNF2-related protein [Leisingera sp. NJS204]|uniref:SNF2-related protein n=1 Tax=Leisingera sp. NJS204 TaxID=2508307 RepID=UPI0010101E51|nr:SNF2-related protein [Leisingera sp. NJS204]QAX31287.1 hypothetical protein ETW24_18945 [Leisingera sp. NJS204]
MSSTALKTAPAFSRDREYPTQEALRAAFEYDAQGFLVHRPRVDSMGRPNKRYEGKRAGNLDSNGRWRITLDGVFYEGHRLIWIWHNGQIPEGRVVDHADGDPLNNRIENLRVATVAQNNANRCRKTDGATSQYFGVSWHSARGKWTAQAKKDGTVHYIGSFDDEREAALARDSFVRGLHDGFEKLNFPGELNRFDLHEYQERAVQFIKDTPSCALWVEMGLGKSVSVLTAVSDLLQSFEAHRVLIIAPLRVALNTWPTEIGVWGHLRHLSFCNIHGSPAARVRKVLTDRSDIHIINRELVSWLVQTLKENKSGWPYDVVVIDEASSFKSASTKRFKALRKALPAIGRLIELTGTPASNGLLDVWPQVFLLDRGARLGKTFTAYRDRYFVGDYMGYNWDLRKGADQQIYDAIGDICLTLTAEDYLDLPDRIDNVVELALPQAARAQYQQLERDFLAEIGDDTVEVFNAAALSNKLLQFANGAVYTDDAGTWAGVHDTKLDALAGIVDEMAGAPLLVAHNFKSDAAGIQKRFPQAQLLGKDPEQIKAWNRGEIPMLLAHPASAGHGLNLQKGGNTIVWFGLNWSLELYLQFNARLHRQGQTKPTVIHHLAVENTVDQTVLAALGRKDVTQRALLNALRADIGRRV